MIKEIKYGGITTTPSDYESKDGDLASSSGIVIDNGRLLTASKPTTAIEFANGAKPIFVHSTTDGKTYYILRSGNTLEYTEGETPYATIANLTLPAGDVRNIEAIGNTLIVLASDGSIHYILYKDSSYRYLGDHIPTFELGFSLSGKLERSDPRTIEIGVRLEGNQEADLTIKDGDEPTIRNWVNGEIELAKEKFGNGEGCFTSSFFVRYALRLYDGSYTNMSSPVLMEVNRGTSPIVSFWAQGTAGVLSEFCVHLFACQLKMKQIGQLSVLNGWGDVVKGVDIFVSSQQETVNTNGSIGSTIPYYDETNPPSLPPIFDTSLCTGNILTTVWSGQQTSTVRYQGRITAADAFNYDVSDRDMETAYPRYVFQLPYVNNDFEERLRNNASFYKAKSYTFSVDGSTGDLRLPFANPFQYNPVSIEKGRLSMIETQSTLPDDYFSNDKLSANTSFIYNSRLSFGNITRTVFDGFSPNTLNDNFSDPISYGASLSGVKYSVVIVENGVSMLAEKSAGSSLDIQYLQSGTHTLGLAPFYFYYPNPNATFLIVTYKDFNNDDSYLKIPLRPHPSLNGAYAVSLDGVDIRTPNHTAPQELGITNKKVSYDNQVYTSEAYNPYVFKAENVNQIGVGASIKSMATITNPLSPGQVGEFDSYLFTDVGVWGVGRDSLGRPKTPVLVTRDIILDNTDVALLDDSVLFATKQGIMELVGKNTRCISTELDVEGSALALADIGKITDPTNQNPEPPIVTDFKTFISGCKMVYDYVNARIVVFNPALDYAYIYSAKDKAWSIIDRYDLIDTINAYPEAQAVASTTTTTNNVETTTYSILDLSTITDEQTAQAGQPTPTNEGWFITRPISLDADNNFKFIDTIRQNGVFEEYMVKESGEYKGYNAVASRNNPKIGDPVYAETGAHEVVRQVLYGSNDLINWFVCGSSRSRYITELKGAQFKWYRLAVRTKFKYGESLSSVTFSYRIKTDNPHLF